MYFPPLGLADLANSLELFLFFPFIHFPHFTLFSFCTFPPALASLTSPASLTFPTSLTFSTSLTSPSSLASPAKLLYTTPMKHFISSLKSALLEHKTSSKTAVVLQFFFAVLFFALLFNLWASFLNPGMIYRTGDWQKEYDYYSVIKQAVTEGTAPYHISAKYQTTDRFLAIPETDFSPQIILLKWLDIREYMRLNLLLLFLLGFVGLILLAKKFKLGFLTFSFLALIFFLNGHIVSHLSGGHYMWVGYFLLPYFFLFLLNFTEEASPAAAAKLALSIFFIFITGGFHIAVWCMLLLLLTGLFNKKLLNPALFSLGLAALLLSFRLLPSLITYYEKAGSQVRGFYSFYIVLESLIVMHGPDFQPAFRNWQRSWTEYNAYIDIVGLAVILFFGIYLSFKNRNKKDSFRPFYWPLAIIAIMTLSKFGWMPVPPFNSEKVATRMLIIPLLFLAVVSAARLQDYLLRKQKSAAIIVFSVVLLVMLFTSLYFNMELWKPAGTVMEGSFTYLGSTITNIYEPRYKMVFDISIIISALSFLGTLSLLIFGRKTAKNQ